jgi:hypothetical protein
VLIGSMLSSTVPDRYVRPVIAFVIFSSGLKYIGVATTTLGWVLCATLLLCGVAWLVVSRPWTAWSNASADTGSDRHLEPDPEPCPEPERAATPTPVGRD